MLKLLRQSSFFFCAFVLMHYKLSLNCTSNTCSNVKWKYYRAFKWGFLHQTPPLAVFTASRGQGSQVVMRLLTSSEIMEDALCRCLQTHCDFLLISTTDPSSHCAFAHFMHGKRCTHQLLMFTRGVMRDAKVEIFSSKFTMCLVTFSEMEEGRRS